MSASARAQGANHLDLVPGCDVARGPANKALERTAPAVAPRHWSAAAQRQCSADGEGVSEEE